jgi:hypothetical protein
VAPGVKLQLAAVRMLFDCLIFGGRAIQSGFGGARPQPITQIDPGAWCARAAGIMMPIMPIQSSE